MRSNDSFDYDAKAQNANECKAVTRPIELADDMARLVMRGASSAAGHTNTRIRFEEFNASCMGDLTPSEKGDKSAPKGRTR